MKIHFLFTVLVAALLIGGGCEIQGHEASAQMAETVVIVRSVEADSVERLAAKEIRRYLYLRTGKLVPMVESNLQLPSNKELIVVGGKKQGVVRELAARDIKISGSIAGLEAQQYRVVSTDYKGRRAVLIAGGDDAGTLYGTYKFIEQLGVRFYLHGDTIPDGRIPLKLPDVDEYGKPLFELRGIQPFHDFPEGPDWWDTETYKAVIGQLPKMGMNFIGLHTYPEGRAGPEPTVWIGLKEDVEPDGKVKFSSKSSYANSMRGNWGYEAKETGDYSFGAAQLFESDEYGVDIMRGRIPWPETIEQKNEVFNDAGRMLKEAFEYAHFLQVRTCVGTETPLTIPEAVRKHIKELGKDHDSPKVVQEVYEGIFRRIMLAYPIDYYWLWTPERWLGRITEEQVENTEQDVLTAHKAAKEVGARFKLGTCGWVLGPKADAAGFDKWLPEDMFVSCINRAVGKAPVEPAFARVKGRDKWAIPWLEDDPAMIQPQLWVGRMRKDAADAYRYGCNGLMGIHWRTRILAPNVSALAKAAWEHGKWADEMREHSKPEGLPRYLPTNDFYHDWAICQFGSEAAKEIAEIFIKVDGQLPQVCTWVKGPGAIAINEKTWLEVKKDYYFVEELAKLLPKIKGDGNRERFGYWLNNFRYMRAMAHVGCTLGELESAIAQIEKEQDEKLKRDIALKNALPLREQLVQQWATMMTYLLETVSNTGEMGMVANIEQHSMERLRLFAKYDVILAKWLDGTLLDRCKPWKDYRGRSRVILPTVRTMLLGEEDLRLKIIILSKEVLRETEVYWRTMGAGKWSKAGLTHIARGVYVATIEAKQIDGQDIEYYVKVVPKGDKPLYFPATAPQMNQTVVVTNFN